MIVLAIDTALEDCSVALSRPAGARLAERTIGRGHAEILMPVVARLLAETGIGVADISRIAVSTGPGSFTGLRVGISAARGLALAHDTPVLGLPTLFCHAALAIEIRRQAGGPARPVLVVLPARADEFYAQMFSADGEPIEALVIASAGLLAERARAGGYDVAGAGAAALGSGFSPLHLRSAPAIATLLDLGARLDPARYPPVPVYGKAPDAVPKRDGIARQ